MSSGADHAEFNSSGEQKLRKPIELRLRPGPIRKVLFEQRIEAFALKCSFRWQIPWIRTLFALAADDS